MMLDRGEHTSKLAKYNFGIAVVLIIFNIVAPFITSSPILHAKAYRNLIGEVKESKFINIYNKYNFIYIIMCFRKFVCKFMYI